MTTKTHRRNRKATWLAIAALVAIGQAPAADAAVAIRNFRQIIEGLSAVTGILPTDREIAAYYSQAITRLPKDGKSEEITAPSILAFTALSSLFCKAMIAKDSLLAPEQRRAHVGVDFARGPEALDEAARTRLIEEYAGLFWRRSPAPAEVEILTQAMAETQALSPATPDGTKTLLLVACSAVASSLDSLVF